MCNRVLCLQVWASSLWSSGWFAPTAAAVTPCTLLAHATSWWTWRWTDTQFPPHPHTAALTGKHPSRTPDTRPKTISGTPSCFRATDVGSKTNLTLGGVSSALQWRSRGIFFTSRNGTSISVKIRWNLWRFQWFFSPRYLLPVKTTALQETCFEVTLPLGNKGPLNLPLGITSEAHMLDYFFFFQCQEQPVFVPCWSFCFGGSTYIFALGSWKLLCIGASAFPCLVTKLFCICRDWWFMQPEPYCCPGVNANVSPSWEVLHYSHHPRVFLP